MIKTLAVAAALLAAIALPAAGQSVPHPWEAASRLVKATEADINTKGIQGIRAHAAELEAALAEGQKLPADGVVDGQTLYVLADAGPPTIAALLTASAVKIPGVTSARAIASPYPAIAFFLGTYDNEIGRPEDALRVLDAGLALEAWNGAVFGEFRPILVSERGAALTGLKRWPEALANYEDGLKLRDLPDHFKAVMQRGRGFALVELGRLDDGQAAYELSLKFDPGNSVATRELQYIARVRAGGQRTAPTITLPDEKH
jgi:tetratricopeptide (TPR) repeat protein